MREDKPTLTNELNQHIGTEDVGKAPPFLVNTYRELVELVAHLSYLNKDNLLFFRGQTIDFLNKGGVSSFYPSIYRDENLEHQEVTYRFKLLNHASRQLRELFKHNKVEGFKDVNTKLFIQWSILQHYGVCSTPLLDLTHSLRVACSFAQQDEESENSYVYVFGLPYITNRISINSEHDIVNIRLLSICPPDAIRPYFQEGYLAGTTDITDDYEKKRELDFNRRLVAKFVIPNNRHFWGSGLRKIPKSILYPPKDYVEQLCKRIETNIMTEMHPGDIGEFLSEWVKFEKLILQKARHQKDRWMSLGAAVQILYQFGVINKEQAYQINEIRKYRNLVVHDPNRIDSGSIVDYLLKLSDLRAGLRWDKEH